jgi:hypothetical protein
VGAAACILAVVVLAAIQGAVRNVPWELNLFVAVAALILFSKMIYETVRAWREKPADR